MRHHYHGNVTISNIKDVVTALEAACLAPKSLPLFNSLTECDTNSFLFVVTKKQHGEHF